MPPRPTESSASARRAGAEESPRFQRRPTGPRSTATAGGDLHLELNRLSKQGRWDDMTGLIEDDVLEAIAVVGPRNEIAGKLRERLAGVADGVSLTHNRAPDPEMWADVVRDLSQGGARAGATEV